MIPARADSDKQAEYLEKEMMPRLEEAKAGKRHVFFVDAAHFVMAPFLGFLWSVARVFIKAPAGRQRFNVLGAVDAITHKIITVTNNTYINAESVCEMLKKIAACGYTSPVTLFLDNARYQKCSLVASTASDLNIELCYLPSYSPNLNLIERLWKFVRKQCLNSQYYDNFSDFRTAISDCLAEAHNTHKKDLRSLLSLRFQLFDKTNFVAA